MVLARRPVGTSSIVLDQALGRGDQGSLGCRQRVSEPRCFSAARFAGGKLVPGAEKGFNKSAKEIREGK